MNFADIQTAINERVAEQLGSAIYSRFMRDHKKHEWRTCKCSFCKTKRDATYDIGHVPMVGLRRKFEDWESYVQDPITEHWLPSYMYRKMYRDKKREKYHAIMDACEIVGV